MFYLRHANQNEDVRLSMARQNTSNNKIEIAANVSAKSILRCAGHYSTGKGGNNKYYKDRKKFKGHL